MRYVEWGLGDLYVLPAWRGRDITAMMIGVALDYSPSGLTWRLTCPAKNALEGTAKADIRWQ